MKVRWRGLACAIAVQGGIDHDNGVNLSTRRASKTVSTPIVQAPFVNGAKGPAYRKQRVSLRRVLSGPAKMLIDRVTKRARRAPMADRPLVRCAHRFIEREVREVMIPQ